MPFSMTSYFLGVGTVVGALALGFGGGIVLTNTAIKDTPAAPSRVERAARSEPVPSPQMTEAKAVAVPRADAAQVQAAVEPKAAEPKPIVETSRQEQPLAAEPVRQIDTSKPAEQPVRQVDVLKAAEPVRQAEPPPAEQLRSTEVKQVEPKESAQRIAEREKRRAEARRIEREKRIAERERKARSVIVVRRQQPLDVEERVRPELAFQREEPQRQGGLFEGLFGRPAGDDRD